MGELADRFSVIFRSEHRAVRDGLLGLAESLKKRDRSRVSALLGQVSTMAGPHFQYEEEALYPSLRAIFGPDYIRKLFADHDRIIASARRLVELADHGAWTDEEIQEGVGLVRGILPHVSDCDGLSLMVERLPEETVRRILKTRDRCNEEGLDLLRWAQVRAATSTC